MSESTPEPKGKGIWSRITEQQLVIAIASLNDRVSQLRGESWRLKNDTRSSKSLWAEVIEKLKLKNTERTRQSLEKIWCLKRKGIDKLVEKQIISTMKNENNEHDGNVNELRDFSAEKKTNPNLLPKLSVPLPTKPNTRINRSDNSDSNAQSEFDEEVSFVLTAAEWKSVFSRTDKKMKPGWTNLFYEKLKSCGITCVVGFKKSYVKTGKRKQKCKYFNRSQSIAKKTEL